MTKSDELSFHQYQEEIKDSIMVCPDNRLNLFCYDVISRILLFVETVDTSDLHESEIDNLKILKQETQNYPVNWNITGKCLDELIEIAEQDEEHAQDMDHSIVEFLCALDNWRHFIETGNKVAVGRVSENLMNILDFNFTGDVLLEKWLTVPEINDEFNNQINFLRNSQSNSFDL